MFGHPQPSLWHIWPPRILSTRNDSQHSSPSQCVHTKSAILVHMTSSKVRFSLLRALSPSNRVSSYNPFHSARPRTTRLTWCGRTNESESFPSATSAYPRRRVVRGRARRAGASRVANMVRGREDELGWWGDVIASTTTMQMTASEPGEAAAAESLARAAERGDLYFTVHSTFCGGRCPSFSGTRSGDGR